jgi:hypothetical protein
MGGERPDARSAVGAGEDSEDSAIPGGPRPGRTRTETAGIRIPRPLSRASGARTGRPSGGVGAYPAGVPHQCGRKRSIGTPCGIVLEEWFDPAAARAVRAVRQQGRLIII